MQTQAERAQLHSERLGPSWVWRRLAETDLCLVASSCLRSLEKLHSLVWLQVAHAAAQPQDE